MAVPKTSALVNGGTSAGIDQGIDFTGGPFNIFALGDGYVTRLEQSGSGWPGQGALLVYNVLKGPAAGKSVYVAEDFAPASGLVVGGPVKQGQVIGQASGSGQAPGIEVGFADAQGHAFGSPTGGPQPMGRSFLTTVEMISGLAPVPTGAGPTMTVPAPGGRIGLTSGGISSQSGAGVGGVVSAVSSAIDATKSVGSFLGKLSDPSFWLRVLQMLAGAVLAGTGVYLLAKQVGLAVPRPPMAQLAEAVA